MPNLRCAPGGHGTQRLFQRAVGVARLGKPAVALVLVLSLVGAVARANQPAVARAMAPAPLATVLSKLQPKMVKIFGAGGFRGMEAYQSGFLISDEGHVLTAWSYVLDTDSPTVVLGDGRKFDAELVGAHPGLEIAVLKVDAADLPHFDLARAVEARSGTRVLALSNLFGVATGNEWVSVQHGVVSVKTLLSARRGTFDTPYHGPVYVLDAATNNPGAAGGALVAQNGELIGILGKELRNTLDHTWLNYAIPIEEVREPIARILAGKAVAEAEKRDRKPVRPLALAELGIVMVPEVLARTPPYVDLVRSGSPAERAGMRPDDLVVMVNDQLIQSCRVLREELARIDREAAVRVSVMRGGQLVEFTLEAAKP
ncbi:MAG: trypsin-like peptidase domain-containing protein [Pirellulales bacterium]|nr:trypsin-like peptidase domain-containing protein [Pirellulales bacterium]